MTWEVRWGFDPASQLGSLMGLGEACWDLSFREFGCSLRPLAQALVLLDHLLALLQLQEPDSAWAAASLALASFLGQPFEGGLAGAVPGLASYKP